MIRKWLIIIMVFCIIPFAYSQACNPTYLNNEILVAYLLNETDVTYDNAVGTSDWDLTAKPNGAPTRTVQTEFPSGYGQDFEASSSIYVQGINTAVVELYQNITMGMHLIPEVAPPDHGAPFGTLENVAGGWEGHLIQMRTAGHIAVYEYNGGAYTYAQSSNTFTHGKHLYLVVNFGTAEDEIFINNSEVSYSAQQSGNVDFTSGQHQSNIGAYASAGQPFDGIIGEFVIFNVTLNSSCRQYIQDNSYPYIADNTIPDITLQYPVNNTRYNNYNGSIIFNASDDVAIENCTINNSNWDWILQNGTDFHLNYTAPDNNYSITISCNDTSANQRNQSFNFLVDTTNPSITVYSPLDNSYYNSDVLINVSYYDLYLYQTRTYINRTDNNIDSIQLHSGTLTSGNLNSLQTFDSDWYNISENGGTVLFFNYTDVENFTGVQIYYNYNGNPAHNMYLAFYNYDTEAWDNYIQLDSGFTGWENYSFTAFGIDGFVYVNNLTGLVQGRINHTSPPNNAHYTAIDIISINGTERYHYLNYSGILFQEEYNISEFWNISEEPDGMYNIIFEATDTHTANIFNDGYNTEEGLTPSRNNYYKKYYMNHGEIEFITPLEIEIIDWRETDRIKQQFYSLLETDLEEVEIEIIADSIEYFEDSDYNCHLILNKKYWYDCEGLNNAEVLSISPSTAKFKFFHTVENDIAESLGGLNYINTSYNFYIDTTNPIIDNYTVTNSTTSLKWDLFFSENVTYNYSIGLNCSDNSIDTGTGNDTDISVTNLLLASATVHYMNITLIDFASNSNNYCINGTTVSTAIDYTIISAIVNQSIADALEEEGRRMNEGLIIVIIFIIWAFILVASYLTRTSAGIMFASVWGIFTSIWLWSSTDFPKFVVVTFSAVCIWLIYIMWGEDFN